MTTGAVLVVEDEQKVANALREGLESEGYEVAVASTGEDAFFRVSTETFDVVLLDLTLPGRDGLEILRALRQRGPDTRVLILTARDTLDDRVKGLDSGADDYLVKPFAFAELIARIRALVRRGRSGVAAAARRGPADGPVDQEGDALGPAHRADGARVRVARVPAAVRGTGGLARDARPRGVAGARPDADARQRHRRARRAAQEKIDAEPGVKLIHTVRGVGFVVREEAA